MDENGYQQSTFVNVFDPLNQEGILEQVGDDANSDFDPIRIKYLVPVFAASGTLNFLLIVAMFVLAYKNLKLGQREFFRPYIMIFVVLAYVLRIIQYIYASSSLQEHEYNRPFSDKKQHRIYAFLAFAPVMLHGLGGLAYWCRWCHYYLLTISATVEDHIKLQKYTKINKIAFFVIVGAGILVIILNFAAMVMRQFALIYVIIFLTFIGVFLQVIVTMFISKMKQFLLHSSNQKETMMKKVPIIRLYSYLITFSLAFRVLSLIIDTIIQQRFQWDSPSDDPSIERWTPNGMLYR